MTGSQILFNCSTSYSTYSTVIIGYEMPSETQTMNIWGNHRKCQQQLIPLHIKSFRARALHNIPLIRAARKDNTYVQLLTNLVIEKDIYTIYYYN